MLINMTHTEDSDDVPFIERLNFKARHIAGDTSSYSQVLIEILICCLQLLNICM